MPSFENGRKGYLKNRTLSGVRVGVNVKCSACAILQSKSPQTAAKGNSHLHSITHFQIRRSRRGQVRTFAAPSIYLPTNADM